MRKLFRVALPTAAVIAFGAISYGSYHNAQQHHQLQARYFVWSTLRLDSDPLGKRYPSPCANLNTGESCFVWEDLAIYRHPSNAERVFVLLDFPAMIVGMFVSFMLGRIGVNEIWTFMISIPLLTAAWCFLVGRILDRRIFQRERFLSTS
jgi:hypothetical protein